MIRKTFVKGDTVEFVLDGSDAPVGSLGQVLGIKQDSGRVVVKLAAGGLRSVLPSYLATVRSVSVARSNSEDFRTRLHKAKEAKKKVQDEEEEEGEEGEVEEEGKGEDARRNQVGGCVGGGFVKESRNSFEDIVLMIAFLYPCGLRSRTAMMTMMTRRRRTKTTMTPTIENTVRKGRRRTEEVGER